MKKFKERRNLDSIVNSPSMSKAALQGTVDFIKKNEFKKAEICFAKLTLRLIEELEAGEIKPDQADGIFTLLDIYISDNFEEPPFTDLLSDLLMEGMILHHYGDNSNYGPDLNVMKAMARKLIGDVKH